MGIHLSKANTRQAKQNEGQRILFNDRVAAKADERLPLRLLVIEAPLECGVGRLHTSRKAGCKWRHGAVQVGVGR